MDERRCRYDDIYDDDYELESVILEIVVVSEPTTTSGKYLFT